MLPAPDPGVRVDPARQLRANWVNKALSLLPDWTRWCASKTALDAEAAERALAAARAEAAILASGTDTITEDEAPFRRPGGGHGIWITIGEPGHPTPTSATSSGRPRAL